jgi:hypothetical protein
MILLSSIFCWDLLIQMWKHWKMLQEIINIFKTKETMFENDCIIKSKIQWIIKVSVDPIHHYTENDDDVSVLGPNWMMNKIWMCWLQIQPLKWKCWTVNFFNF